MENANINRQWLLKVRPDGLIRDEDFDWHEAPVPDPGDGQVLVRNIYLSLDPTNRLWADEADSYMPPVQTGEVMRGATIGVVEQSNDPGISVGTIVQGLLGWQDYAVADSSDVTPLGGDSSIPLTAYFDIFGHIGITAYFALLDIGKPVAGETLVVSAAAGAVGSIVGQIGKIKGCRVVGITGTDEKCRWITETLGFDGAVNYKNPSESVLEGLKRNCPDGIDIVYENVGGESFEAALSLINVRARIVLCGLISQYNATEPVPGPSNLINVLANRARIEGFIVMDHFHRAGEAMAELGPWYADGKIKTRIDVVDGLENAVHAVNKLFDGTNKGKLIVKISEEP